MSDVVGAPWTAPLLAHLVGATATLVVACVADLPLRRRGRHGARAVLWIAATLRLVLPPDLLGVSVGPTTPLVAPSTSAVVDAASAPLAATLLCVWAFGAAAAFVGATRRARAFARRLRATSVPEDAAARAEVRALARRLGLSRAVELVLTSDGDGPCVLGLRRPTLFAPASLFEAGRSAEREDVLLHELAHVRRGDLLLGAGLAALRAAYWFHPLVGVLVRRVTELREIGCDDAVRRAATDGGARYRSTLLRAAAERYALPSTPFATAWASPAATLLVRLRRLDVSPARDDGRRRVSLAAVAAVLFACAPVAVVEAAARPALADDAALDAAAEGVLARRAAGGRESCLAVRHAVFRLAARDAAAPADHP